MGLSIVLLRLRWRIILSFSNLVRRSSGSGGSGEHRGRHGGLRTYFRELEEDVPGDGVWNSREGNHLVPGIQIDAAGPTIGIAEFG
jgi:hypothetical protein